MTTINSCFCNNPHHSLFEREPDAKNLFKRVNVDDLHSPEFKAHCIRVVNGLDTVISLLDDPFVMLHQLEHLGKQHQVRDGVKKEHFDVRIVSD